LETLESIIKEKNEELVRKDKTVAKIKEEAYLHKKK
jgi:hypothetical protein